MKRELSWNYSVLSGPSPAKPRRNYLGHSKGAWLFIEMERRYVIKFFVEEGMKEVEIIDRLNKHYGWDAIQPKASVFLV
jgi:hypothetical protein